VIEHTLEPAVAHLPGAETGINTETATDFHGAEVQRSEVNEERVLAGVSVTIALLGIGVGWVLFQRRPLLQMPRILENKYYVDEIYDATLIRPIETVSREGFWKIVDVGVIDGGLHALGEAVTELGRLGRYLQAGFVRGYAAIILLGALILIGLFAYLGFPVTR
jgi:NADH-quinone oxidoreductase subunit L